MAKVMLVLSVAWKINFLQPYIMTVTCSDTSCGRVYLRAYTITIVLDIIRIIYLFRFSNIVLFWLILKLEKILKNEKVFIYLQI